MVTAVQANNVESPYKASARMPEIVTDLSDIRRAAPEKWRTILRQPIRLAH
jgi:hypothetical protein